MPQAPIAPAAADAAAERVLEPDVLARLLPEKRVDERVAPGIGVHAHEGAAVVEAHEQGVALGLRRRGDDAALGEQGQGGEHLALDRLERPAPGTVAAHLRAAEGLSQPRRRLQDVGALGESPERHEAAVPDRPLGPPEPAGCAVAEALEGVRFLEGGEPGVPDAQQGLVHRHLRGRAGSLPGPVASLELPDEPDRPAGIGEARLGRLREVAEGEVDRLVGEEPGGQRLGRRDGIGRACHEPQERRPIQPARPPQLEGARLGQPWRVPGAQRMAAVVEAAAPGAPEHL